MIIALPVSIKACDGPRKEVDELVIRTCAEQVTELKIGKCHEAIRRIKSKAPSKEEKYKEIMRRWFAQAPLPKEIPDREQFHSLRKLAISSHYAPILKHLLEKKIVDANSEFNGTSGRVYRLLNEAAFNKSHEGVAVLLEFGADPNHTGCNFDEFFCWQESPLFTAVDARDNRMLLLLLNKKADPNKHYKYYGPLPLMRVLDGYRSNDPVDVMDTQIVVATLLEHGANPDEKEPRCVLHELSQGRYFTPRELAIGCGYKNILTLFDSVKKESAT